MAFKSIETPEIPQQDLHGNKESEPQNGDEHECIPEVIIDDVQDERSEQTLLTDDLHESNKFGDVAKI